MKNPSQTACAAVITGAILCSVSACADAKIGLKDLVPLVTGQQTEQNNTQGGYALSEQDVAMGLKETLAVGVERSINQLGQGDGFWSDALVRVALPPKIAQQEKLLRNLGFGSQIDAFHLTLNRAAEQAVPKVSSIFGDAIRQMSWQDAWSIYKGDQGAATAYFRKVADTQLVDVVKPIVTQATASAGVTASYKKMVKKMGPLAKSVLGVEAQDLDTYVTRAALDGLYTTLAKQEAEIRQNPVAQTTALLRKLFGK